MKTKLLLFVVAFSFVFSGLKAQVDVGDSLALVDLYNGTKGNGWNFNTNWLTKKPVSTWYGVEVTDNHVTGLYMTYNNMKGKIPESIGNFDSLVSMQLGGNKFQGEIPAVIGEIKTLQDVFLSFSSLTGPIPATVGDLPALSKFQVAGNFLTGTIPESLGNCRHLSLLNLSDNILTGSLPSSFRNLTELKMLYLSRNDLSGSIPNVFPVGGMLTELDLLGNQFSGVIPAFLGSLLSLKFLSLGENKLSGLIPEELGNLNSLQKLILYKNQLTGRVPKNFANFPKSTSIDLSENMLTETMNPQASGKVVTLTGIFLDYNNFTFNGLEYFEQKFRNAYYSYQAPLSIHAFGGGLSVSAGGTLANNTYTWFRMGKGGRKLIVGDSTFIPPESGSYYCTIKNKIATQLTLHSDTLTYITNPVVKNKLTISISPNPARGLISIYGLDEKSDAKITIADMSGYMWMRAMSRQQPAMKVDVSRLRAGNYLVNVSDGKEVKTVMFVKE